MTSWRARLLPALVIAALAVPWLTSCASRAPEQSTLDGSQPLRVGLLATGNFPFTYPAQQPTPDNHAGLEGFEDRLAGVANGSFDLTISALSFTPGREAVLHFVRPFYYSSGVALFADTSRRGLALLGPGPQGGQDLTAPAGWRGVFSGNFPVGQTLCFVEGYYALPFILQDLDINTVVSPTLEEATAATRGGRCAALAYDSVAPSSQVGLPQLNAPPAYVAPYGVGISQADAGSELERRLVWGLTELMNQGNSSRILQLEQQWLVANGVGPSSALQGVVDAISTFGSSLEQGPGRVPESYSLFNTRPGGRRFD